MFSVLNACHERTVDYRTIDMERLRFLAGCVKGFGEQRLNITVVHPNGSLCKEVAVCLAVADLASTISLEYATIRDKYPWSIVVIHLEEQVRSYLKFQDIGNKCLFPYGA